MIDKSDNSKGVIRRGTVTRCVVYRGVRRTAGDPSAALYANAVATAGGTITPAHRIALSTFFSAERASGRLASLKWLQLPIWGSAGPNAINAVNLSTGTFGGGAGVTHSAGYAAANGTTGFFDMGIGPVALGLTVASQGFGWLAWGGGTNAANTIGCQDAATYAFVGQWFGGTGPRMLMNDTGAGLLGAGAGALSQNHGILSMQRFAGQRNIRRRVTAGVASMASNVSADSAVIPATNIYTFGMNNNGTLNAGNDLQHGAFFVNSGWSNADDDAFTLNLKTLCEALTGLILP